MNSSRQPTNIGGKTVLGRGGSKCKVVTSGRSMVLMKTERQPEWLTYSEWVRSRNGLT